MTSQRHLSWAWLAAHDEVTGRIAGTALVLVGIAGGTAISLISLNWHSAQTWATLWVTVVLMLAVVGLGLLVRGARRRKKLLLRDNGTAFLVQETAGDWGADDTPGGFLDEVGRRFAGVFAVPGPVRLYQGWTWPLDDRAAEWEEKSGALARSFRTLYLAARDPQTPAAVFIWAWWPVAVALGAALSSADRQLHLTVWQRPSKARGGTVTPDLSAQRPHQFGDQVPDQEFPGWIEVAPRVTRLTTAGPAARHARPVSVLVIRTSTAAWGPLGQITGDADSGIGPLTVHSRARVTPEGPAEAQVHELRCLTPGGPIAWEDFPALVGTCARWLLRKAADLDGHTLLLGANLPQEAALGLGVCAGLDVCADHWPADLWPVVYQRDGRRLVIPQLNLGTANLGKGR